MKPSSFCPASGLIFRRAILGWDLDVLTTGREEGQISLKERAFPNLNIQMNYTFTLEIGGGGGGGGR